MSDTGGSSPKKRTEDIRVGEEFTFSKFTISDKLMKSLKKMNFVKPSPIQLKVLPLARCGLDMILQAKSGTGKTLAFSICLLENFDPSLNFPQALLIVPTREIAVQIVAVLSDLGGSMNKFNAAEFIGGTDITDDRMRIQKASFVVGTPGRILHLIKNEVFNISCLKSVVLDEADKLVESGKMAREVMSILDFLPKKIQIIAATATVTSQLETIMKKKMRNPIGITPKHEIPVLLGVKQFVKMIPRENDNINLMTAKIDELVEIFTRITFKQCLLFTESQTKTETYGNYLAKRGWKNEIISGAQDQSQRLQVLDKLTKFKCRILITTDLMARGIDIENINLIINLELPRDCNTYLHRIGRAGRFGTHGIAITLVNGEEELEKFQRMLGDIGGESLKAMKYPEKDVSYDFWDFSDQVVLETVAGVSRNGEAEDEKVENGKSEEEIVAANLALLEITRKLVDTKVESETFDLDAMLEDYQNATENGHHQNGGGGAEEEENIFLKTIEDLNLYDDEEEKIHKEDSEENSPKVKKVVIFKRSDVGEDDEIMSDESSLDEESDEHEENEDSDDEESENEENEDSEDEESKNEEFQEEETPKPKVKRPKCDNQSFSFMNQQQQPVNFGFNQNVYDGYSQWQNIYLNQLANIQNYLQFSKK